jgi:hypothetical protein
MYIRGFKSSWQPAKIAACDPPKLPGTFFLIFRVHGGFWVGNINKTIHKEEPCLPSV